MRTRIKICGITDPRHAEAAVDHGADAIGLVFHPDSPRAVSLAQAQDIAQVLPPFVVAVALFVNPTRAAVEEVLSTAPIGMLQFHGDESPEFCAGFGRPYLKAIRVRAGANLLECAAPFQRAAGWLFDAYSTDAYGGTGKVFDWNLIPSTLSRPLVLSGGLNPGNVEEAVRKVRPWAVDVSSGVEVAKGVKDERLIAAFIAGVRHADGMVDGEEVDGE